MQADRVSQIVKYYQPYGNKTNLFLRPLTSYGRFYLGDSRVMGIDFFFTELLMLVELEIFCLFFGSYFTL